MRRIDSSDIIKFYNKSKTGFWKIEMVDGNPLRLYLDEIMDELLGIEGNKSAEECCKFLLDHIHKDDVAIIKDYFKNMLDGEAEVVYRYNHPKKNEVYVRCCGRKIDEKDGVVILAGYHKDLDDVVRLGDTGKLESNLIIKNRSLEKEKLLAKEYIRNITDHAACGIVSFTLPNYKKLYMNFEALRVYGLKSIEELGSNYSYFDECTHYHSQNTIYELKKIEANDGAISYECSVSNKLGYTSQLLVHTEISTNLSGERYVYITFLDVSENKALQNDKNILKTLCMDYFSSFCLDFKKKKVFILKQVNTMPLVNSKISSFDVYNDNISNYFNLAIDKKSSPDFSKVLNTDYLEEYLKNTNKINYRFIALEENGIRHHIEATVAKATDNDSIAVLGFRVIDETIAEEEQKKKELEEKLNTIGGLSNAYFAVYWVDLDNKLCRPIKNISYFEEITTNCSSVFDVIYAFNNYCVMPEDFKRMNDFTDISKLKNKLKNNNVVVEEFHGAISPWTWCRASWVVASRDSKDNVNAVLFTVEDITSIVLERQKHENDDRLMREQNYIISGLSQEYTTVWLVTNQGNKCIKYQDSGRDELASDVVFFNNDDIVYENAIKNYCKSFVCENYQDEFIKKTNYDYVLEKIKNIPVYNIIYKRIYKDKEEYFQLSYALADRTGQSDNFVMGIKNVDELVSEERRKNDELKKALKEAEFANNAKTQFLNNMSHDIRTPMNAILGYSKLMRDEIHSPKFLNYQDKLEKSGNMLLSLINNVLNMARIESGKMELDENYAKVCDIIDGICSVFEVSAKNKNINFTYEYNVEHQHILCDVTKIQEIVVNLISNAFKFTPSGGAINVETNELSCEDGYVVIETKVSDNGIGMSPDFIPLLFDSFTRERNTTVGKISGSGLGMAIIKKLVDMMNGKIDVSSKLGEGTTFVVTIKHRIADKIYYDCNDEDTNSKKLTKISKKHILLAEDNKLNAEIAMAILTKMNFIIDRVDDGVKCVAKIESEPAGTYDLILMDIQMPNMDGYKATELIRKLADPEKASIPIVAMTANAFLEDERLAIASGMDRYISKPLDVLKIEEVLTSIFEK